MNQDIPHQKCICPYFPQIQNLTISFLCCQLLLNRQRGSIQHPVCLRLQRRLHLPRHGDGIGFHNKSKHIWISQGFLQALGDHGYTLRRYGNVNETCSGSSFQIILLSISCLCCVDLLTVIVCSSEDQKTLKIKFKQQLSLTMKTLKIKFKHLV